MAYNVSQKLHDNLRAIRTALDYQNGRPLTAEDVANLKKYAGFGGIKAVLYPYGSSEDWLSLAKTETSAKTVDIVPNAIFVDTNNDTYKANLLFGTYTKTDNNENAIKIEDKSILGVENK